MGGVFCIKNWHRLPREIIAYDTIRIHVQRYTNKFTARCQHSSNTNLTRFKESLARFQHSSDKVPGRFPKGSRKVPVRRQEGSSTVPARFQDSSGFSGRAFSCHHFSAPEIETQQIHWEYILIQELRCTLHVWGQVWPSMASHSLRGSTSAHDRPSWLDPRVVAGLFKSR